MQQGETCAMIYVFDTAQNMQVCCGRPVTADGLLTLQISTNLAPNPVGSLSILMNGSIRILSKLPNATPGASPGKRHRIPSLTGVWEWRRWLDGRPWRRRTLRSHVHADLAARGRAG